MDHTPDDPSDQSNELAQPVDGTQMLAPPPDGRPTRTRSLLIGLIAVFSVGIVAVGVAIAADLNDTPDGGQVPAAVIETGTGTSTAGSVQQAVDSTSNGATSTRAAAEAPVTTLPSAPQQPGEQRTDQPQAQATTPPVPPGHVDSCAYPNMKPTVVSGTTYTPAPTPTVTVVTSPETCPPYSAGYPWDGS